MWKTLKGVGRWDGGHGIWGVMATWELIKQHYMQTHMRLTNMYSKHRI
jgi:hypothetical protein